MRRSLRLIAALLVVGAVGFGASAAFATTGSSTAGSISFTVSLPDAVTKGQTANYSGSVSNTSQVATISARVTFNLSGPGVNKSASYFISLTPGKSIARSGSFVVPQSAQSGSYTLTMNVSTANASGQASASSTVA